MRESGIGYSGKRNSAAMKLPDIVEVRTLATVMEQKSFTKAARHLGFSLTRVSGSVRELEERLGVRLIERTTRSVEPTPAGEHLLNLMRPILTEYEAALESTSVFRDKPAGLLRLTVAPSAAELVLARLLAPFLAAYPDIELDISVDNGVVDIVSGHFDAGIRLGNHLPQDMISVRISKRIPFVVVAAPGYLSLRGVPMTPRDLAKHACLSVRLSSGAVMPWRFSVDGRTVEVQVNERLTATSIRVQIAAAVGGSGLFQILHDMVAHELAAGDLTTVLDDWAPPACEGFFLYYTSRRQMRPALRAFVDFMRDHRH